MSKYGKFPRPCNASGQRYTNYAGTGGPDDEQRMSCPECGKEVKLRALYPAARGEPARTYIVIPFHNKPALERK